MQRSKHNLRHRILRHHLPVAAIAVVAVLLLYLTRPYKDVITRLSFATAYPAFILLGITLLLGPFRVLVNRRNPISSDLRRDIGIWAAILGIVHAAVGQCVHLRGRPWLYYVYGHTERHTGLRHDLFGLANHTGAIATLLLIALVATSNDLSLRALGTPGWKALQRWNYAIFALGAIHALAYQAIEKQKIAWVGAIVVCSSLTLAIQGTGFWKRRRADQKSVSETESAAAVES